MGNGKNSPGNRLILSIIQRLKNPGKLTQNPGVVPDFGVKTMLYPLPDEVLSARPVIPAQPRTLLTVQQFCTKHAAWTPGAIRNMIFHSQPRKSSRGPIPGNGLAPAIIRLGRKVLIDEAKFFEWLDRQQRGNAA